MESIFGDYSTRLTNPIACEWAAYWQALVVYEEGGKDVPGKGKTMPIKPTMPGTSDDTQPAPNTSSVILKLSIGALKRKGTESEDHNAPPAKKKPGPRSSSLLDRLSSALIDPTKKTANKSYWICSANGCSHRREGRRMAADVVTHALRCDHLRRENPTARREAEDQHATSALGAEQKDADDQELAPAEVRAVVRPKKLHSLEKGQPTLNPTRFQDAGRKRTKEEQKAWQNTADHLLMMLICKCGLVPNVLDSKDWVTFVTHLNPAYDATGSKKFAKEYIPQEAALVQQKTTLVLQQSRDLTYTTDGTSTRRGDQFYTYHACTPSRDVYFLGGHFGTKESHNAEWIKSGALQTMQDIGTELWAAIGSDSTNVTLAARRGVVNEAPAVQDLCDVVHFIQHIIGDINELPEYESMMEILKPLIRHFSKSGKSKAYLRDSGEDLADDGGSIPVRMLAKIGKTRFATHFMSVTTVSPVVLNIQGLVLDEKIKFTVRFNPIYIWPEVFGSRTSLKLPTFIRDMLSYETIVAPLARSLWSLEATTANASDAFIFWLAIANTLDSVLEKKEKDTGIVKRLAGRVRAVFNTRYSQFFNHNDIYFVAFCLDPQYPNAQFLRERSDIPPNGIADHISYSHAFFRVKEFLKRMLRALLQQHANHDSECRCHPILKTHSDLEIANALRLQLEAFWLGEPPFHAPVINDDTMEWWLNLERGNSPRSNVLAMLGVRIFGILVNSMPDERTNSNITWYNSPLRGNQQQEGLLDMIMVGQWYKYHAPGAEGPRRPPRRPTVAFRRLDQAVIDKTKMKRREEDSETSDSEADSTEIDEEDEEELEKLSDALRAKIARMKRGRKKNNKKTFRSDEVFVVDVDVKLRAPGLKALLSVTDDDSGIEESGSVEPQPMAASQAANWDWCYVIESSEKGPRAAGGLGGRGSGGATVKQVASPHGMTDWMGDVVSRVRMDGNELDAGCFEQGMYRLYARNDTPSLTTVPVPMHNLNQSIIRNLGQLTVVPNWEATAITAISSPIGTSVASSKRVPPLRAPLYAFQWQQCKFDIPTAASLRLVLPRPPARSRAPTPPLLLRIIAESLDGEGIMFPQSKTRLLTCAVPQLEVTPEQRPLVNNMYHPDSSPSFSIPPIDNHIFPLDIEAQDRAAAIMTQYGLDDYSRE
ncbi:ribonuclease H-like domain-containing protein [Mycena rosella]|uniref:Ribonuclease H-like domain-containing protein n=1 Tax=Mycena rosella TaxID=1033263 RepID=A0AAD7CWX6_MYCRO|nr:ribonuclease H-like domain-containing protein [Mycena rosella]